jgi:COMPASS component BRE2
MRCEYFFPKDEAIHEGDVIGMLITLPPLSLHKKVVEGKYDPATDGTGEPDKSEPPPTMNLIRDRIPFHLKISSTNKATSSPPNIYATTPSI